MKVRFLVCVFDTCVLCTASALHDNIEEVELKTITCTDKLRSGTIKARKKGGKHPQSTLHQFADQQYINGGWVSYWSSIAFSTESSALYIK